MHLRGGGFLVEQLTLQVRAEGGQLGFGAFGFQLRIDRCLLQIRTGEFDDQGIGLDMSNLERLFDAFYTTKSDGMGIGLSVSRSIVESHGGRLWAEPNDGPGATFSFSIPRVRVTASHDIGVVQTSAV